MGPMTVVVVIAAIEAGTVVDLDRVTVVVDDLGIDEALHLVDEEADQTADRQDDHQDDRQEDLLDTPVLDLVPAKTQTVVSGRKRLSCACSFRLFSLYFTWGHIHAAKKIWTKVTHTCYSKRNFTLPLTYQLKKKKS